LSYCTNINAMKRLHIQYTTMVLAIQASVSIGESGSISGDCDLLIMHRWEWAKCQIGKAMYMGKKY
ncbi:MAG: hypothetical protein KDE46_11320, partial [Caldilineaceae bacterium]|nr:hypothetical protein [Caldilineaceae bacterium]